MECPRCYQQKNLGKDRYLTQKLVNKTSNCLICGIIIPKDTLGFGCKNVKSNCPFVLCVNCKICPQRHNLRYVYELSILAKGSYGSYISNRYSCDVCKKSCKLKDKLLHCLACQYDICPECDKNEVQVKFD